MRSARRIAAAALGVAAVGLSACESTQDKSARLQREAGHVLNNEKGLSITQPNHDVRIASTQLLQSRGRAAVVVALKNASSKPQVDVPIAIKVTGAGGGTVFQNNLPGLEPSLVSASYIAPHGQLIWINDQVLGKGPKAARAQIGAPRASAPRAVPKITVTQPTFVNDPVSGAEANGDVTNHSGILQVKLIVYGVARKGSMIVAVGRASIPKLRPGRHAHYHIFFVGNPKGATISVQSPPTTFK